MRRSGRRRGRCSRPTDSSSSARRPTTAKRSTRHGSCCPDVVLLDIQLPDADGFAVADRLAAQGSGAEVVLVSSHEAGTYGPRLAAARARGFIPKRNLSGAALAALLS